MEIKRFVLFALVNTGLGNATKALSDPSFLGVLRGEAVAIL
jgi:hypothetical protein